MKFTEIEKEEIRQKYLKLSNNKEVPKSYSCKKLLEIIAKLELVKAEEKRVADFFKNTLKIEFDDFLKDVSISKSSMSIYFMPKQIELFKYSEVNNPYYKKSPGMRLYLISDIAEIAIQKQIIPRDEFKHQSFNGSKETEAKFKAIDNVIIAVRNVLS